MNYLIDAYSKGRHARRWKYLICNPYPLGPMHDAWRQGWESL